MQPQILFRCAQNLFLDHPIHKRGGGGFITYMAMVPQHNVGVFVVVTHSPLTRFTPMSDGVNNMLAELVGNQTGSPMMIGNIR